MDPWNPARKSRTTGTSARIMDRTSAGSTPAIALMVLLITSLFTRKSSQLYFLTSASIWVSEAIEAVQATGNAQRMTMPDTKAKTMARRAHSPHHEMAMLSQMTSSGEISTIRGAMCFGIWWVTDWQAMCAATWWLNWMKAAFMMG